jgi:hypothetical protein
MSYNSAVDYSNASNSSANIKCASENDKKCIEYTNDNKEEIINNILKTLNVINMEIIKIENDINYYNLYDNIYFIYNIQEQQYIEYKKINALVKKERFEIIKEIYENKLKIIINNNNSKINYLNKINKNLKEKKKNIENNFINILNTLFEKHKKQLLVINK